MSSEMGMADYICELQGFIADVNPTEIANQIERDNLSAWCWSWQAAILRAVCKPIQPDTLESLQAEVEKWKEMHNRAALNFQQENAECRKLQAELASKEELLDEAEEYLRSATDDMEDIVSGKDHCKRCGFYAKCEKGNTTSCGQFYWAGPKYES